MNIITKADAILALKPNALFCLTKDDAGEDLLIWESTDMTKPTEEEIQAKLTELQNAE
jgi:hypothetical protein